MLFINSIDKCGPIAIIHTDYRHNNWATCHAQKCTMLFSLGIFSFRNMSCLRSYFWSLPQLIFGQYITVLKYNINQQRKLFVSQTNNRASVWNQTCQLKMCRIIYFYPILFQLNKTYFWLTNGLKTSPKNSFISMQKNKFTASVATQPIIEVHALVEIALDS